LLPRAEQSATVAARRADSMIQHLSREAQLEAAEGRASADARRHLAECGRCRADVDGLVRALNEVRAIDVPEPSPLFWDHLSARVRDAIDREPPLDAPRPLISAGWLRLWLRPAAALVSVGLIAVIAYRVAAPRPHVEPAPRGIARSAPA